MGYQLRQTPTSGFQVWEDVSGAQGAVVQALTWTANRAPTNTANVGSIPPNARILRIDITVPVVSNAATTATVSVGLSGGSNTFFSAAQDVKAAVGNFSQAATANWVTSQSSQIVSCTYTETGTASTAGTIYVSVYYATN